MSENGIPVHETETVRLDDLRPHPGNYRVHPEGQLDHLDESIRQFGVYRNVTVARDGTILAGHGVVEAARRVGLTELQVIRLDLDPDDPEALKVVVGDNEISRLAEIDDRQLSEHLKVIAELDALHGTGFDQMMLANLLYVTRPATEISSLDEAAHWVGLPEFEPAEERVTLVIQFESEEDRDRLIDELKLIIAKKMRKTWSAWWPPKARDDLRSLLFDDGEGDGDG